MKTRRGSLLWSNQHGDAILMYKPGDVVKPVAVTDQFFTGVVRDVDTKTNKITVAWGGGPTSQHDSDELLPMPFFGAAHHDGHKVAGARRMRADVDDLVNAPEIDAEIVSNDSDSETQTSFVDEKMSGLLNRQVGKEFYSAYLYYAVAAIMQSKGLVGFQRWMESQGDDEVEHAMKVFKYLMDTGSTVVLPTIPGPELAYGMEVIELTRFVLDHEMGVTQDWKAIGQLAKVQDNPATCKMVQDFMNEQIEEEDAALTLHQKVKLADSGSGILLIDNDLKDRSPISVTASENNRYAGIISGMKKIAFDYNTATCSDCDMNDFLKKATSGTEPSAQRTIEEETTKISSVSRNGAITKLMDKIMSYEEGEMSQDEIIEFSKS